MYPKVKALRLLLVDNCYNFGIRATVHHNMI